MARVDVTVYEESRAGVLIPHDGWVQGDTTDGHKFLNDGMTSLIIKNETLGAMTEETATVTVLATAELDGLDVGDKVVTLVAPADTGAGENDVQGSYGYWRPKTFNVRTGDDRGYVYFDVDTDGVSFACIKHSR